MKHSRRRNADVWLRLVKKSVGFSCKLRRVFELRNWRRSAISVISVMTVLEKDFNDSKPRKPKSPLETTSQKQMACFRSIAQLKTTKVKVSCKHL